MGGIPASSIAYPGQPAQLIPQRQYQPYPGPMPGPYTPPGTPQGGPAGGPFVFAPPHYNPYQASYPPPPQQQQQQQHMGYPAPYGMGVPQNAYGLPLNMAPMPLASPPFPHQQQQQQQQQQGHMLQPQGMPQQGQVLGGGMLDKFKQMGITSEHKIEEDWLIDYSEVEVSKEIARGSFGVVYQGLFRGTEVAVKKLLVQQLSEQQMDEFMGEIHMMKKLHHPNVVLFIGVALAPPNRAIITELMTGSMWNLLHDKSVTVDAKLQHKLVLDTAKGMNYLHLFKPPVLHRDLKSPNLLVDKYFNVKIADFGLARIKASLMTSNLGTCQYMAPEVIASQSYTEKADIYSFGLVVWEALTRQVPYQGMQPMQIAYGVVHQNLRPPVPQQAHPGLARVMTACWHQDPLQRPTFQEVLNMLKSIQL
eukprot:TRINITY_DN1188_c0_g1_i2.p1 TRINITY_DN1188_c0_g1~~TRINITY_DN1188_c0_g1_i2.p1  ORF type:complete len:457 (+),score=141.64 TRINITY_DN1188_c0_g1_i2:112-1371(+)